MRKVLPRVEMLLAPLLAAGLLYGSAAHAACGDACIKAFRVRQALRRPSRQSRNLLGRARGLLRRLCVPPEQIRLGPAPLPTRQPQSR